MEMKVQIWIKDLTRMMSQTYFQVSTEIVKETQNQCFAMTIF